MHCLYEPARSPKAGPNRILLDALLGPEETSKVPGSFAVTAQTGNRSSLGQFQVIKGRECHAPYTLFRARPVYISEVSFIPPKSYFFKKIVFSAESDKFKFPGKFTDLEKFKQRFSALTAHQPELFGARYL